MTDIAVLKQQARATWAAGDFDAVAELIWEVGGVASELDIAAGNGNAAIQAAQRGADVVASDPTPEGRWEEFLTVYRELTHRRNQGEDGKAALPAAYLSVTGTRR